MKKRSLLKKLIFANSVVFISVFTVFTVFSILKGYGDTYRASEEEAQVNLRKSVASCSYHFKKNDFIELQRFVSSFTEPDSPREILLLFSGDGQIIATNNFGFFNANEARIRSLLSQQGQTVRLGSYVFSSSRVSADSMVYGFAVYAGKIEMRRAIVEQGVMLFVFVVVTLALIILAELFLIKKFTGPLKELISSFRNNDFRLSDTSPNDIQEIVELKESYNFWASEIERYESSLKEKARWEAYSNLAAQVAHDIRSPLAALGAAAKVMDAAPKQKQVIDGAVQRIRSIADDLLSRYRAPGAAKAAAPAPCDLGALAAQVVEEKRLQHAGRAGLEIEFNAAPGVTALADAKEFQRIVSNLINNAVEALGGAGKVSVSLSASGAQAVLEIKDNGHGIPAETLAKLGQKRETHGKQGGTGLGLYHARISAESWGGRLEIASEVGRGTTVTMRLPLAARPEPAAVPKRAVLIDDDALTHMTWELAAQAKGVELLAFTAPGEFLARLDEFPKDLPIYIDSDLGDGVKGEHIAADLKAKGYTALSLATGHLPEKFAGIPWLKVQSKEPPWG